MLSGKDLGLAIENDCLKRRMEDKLVRSSSQKPKDKILGRVI